MVGVLGLSVIRGNLRVLTHVRWIQTSSGKPKTEDTYYLCGASGMGTSTAMGSGLVVARGVGEENR